jgi:hypothetical protein
MGRVLFADESGMLKKDKCYTIGALMVPDNLVDEFDKLVSNLLRTHV